MNQEEYNSIFKYAKFWQLMTIFTWCGKKRLYFDILLEKGYNFQEAFDKTIKLRKKEISKFYDLNQYLENQKLNNPIN